MAASKKSPPADGPALVIVESPAKAKTLKHLLGTGYAVEASIGHVRDLPTSEAKLPEELRKVSRHGVKIEDGFEPIYVVPPDKKEQVARLRRLLKGAARLLLATDEDREGEAISWHLHEVLKPKVPTRRLVFHEITREAIQEAMKATREIDTRLVEAQETRRIVDRLYGYEISPLLWRKIPGARSAGRVQSVALRLLVEREAERMAFRRASYWDLGASFAPDVTSAGEFEALLVEVGGKRVATGRDFDPRSGRLQARDVVHLDEEAAWALDRRLSGKPAAVQSVEEKPYTQAPAPPFTTSTLQQEAGRKLRFSARRTMKVAQSLYEQGAITYMRTDSTTLSNEALEGARKFIRENYGESYLPEKPRVYRTKVKNAQEAHEAIRPAGRTFLTVDEVRRRHGGEAAALYELIWMRTVASQMPNARGRRVTVHVAIEDAVFRATGKTIEFPGFQRAYVEGSDDPRADLAERERILPPLTEGQALHTMSLTPQEHTTQPPARFSEASLVKRLDEMGIGRPSTWASIISTLLDRSYAFRKNGALVPTFTGFAVVRLMESSFGALVDYAFTARMEDDLDAVSRGEQDGKDYLQRFWAGNGAPGLQKLVAEGLEVVDPRAACTIVLGESEGRRIEVRLGRYGLFLTDGESNASLPEETVPDELTLERATELIGEAAAGPISLGDDPETGKPIYVKSGPYGPYVQLGDAEPGSRKKPKMQSLLPGMDPANLTIELACRLLALPRELGPHPEDPEGKPVLALTGRYGPFVKWGEESRSIPEDVSVLDITLEQAVELLKQPRRRGRSATPTALKELGAHPTSGKPLKLMSGRYGPYVTDGEINASLPKGRDPGTVTVAEAAELLQRRAERIQAGGGRTRRGGRKKSTAKKSAPKKKAASKKKAPAKTSTPKKKPTRKKTTRRKKSP